MWFTDDELEGMDDRCVVCSRLWPRHSGLCCDHKYDEQDPCDLCGP